MGDGARGAPHGRMEVEIFLCQGAVAHPDGTVSMIHVGVEKIGTSRDVCRVQLCIVVKIRSKPTESQGHRLTIDLDDADGKHLTELGRIDPLLPPKQGSAIWLVTGITFQQPVGKYELAVNIDGYVYATYGVEVISTGRDHSGIMPRV